MKTNKTRTGIAAEKQLGNVITVVGRVRCIKKNDGSNTTTKRRRKIATGIKTKEEFLFFFF